MNIDSLNNVENRIAQIQSRIDALAGKPAQQVPNGLAVARSPFAAHLANQMAPQRMQPSQWDGLIQQAADTYGVDAGLVKAVLSAESGGNPNAVSRAGAMGLMQLMPATAQSLGVTDPFDPQQNIFGGTRYLRGLLDRLGSPELALAGYNAGPGAVRRFGGIPPYPETQKYVATVMSRWQGSQP